MVKVIPKILLFVGIAAAGVVCGVTVAEKNERKEQKESQTEVQPA